MQDSRQHLDAFHELRARLTNHLVRQDEDAPILHGGNHPPTGLTRQVFELFERFFHRLFATFTGITRREEQNVRRVRQNLFPTNAFRHDARFLKLVDAARDGFDFGKPVSRGDERFDALERHDFRSFIRGGDDARDRTQTRLKLR